MKTPCLTLALLLLLTVCRCNAMPKALQFTTAPGNCCFRFFTRSLPLKLVTSVTETHLACVHRALIVHTIKGKQICYRKTFPWARRVYNLLHNTEGSGQQH